MTLQIQIASQNPVKINAVKNKIKEFGFAKNALISSASVSSGVSDQPVGISEIVLGAQNRAKNAFKAGYSIGIESGALLADSHGQHALIVVACSVFDGTKHTLGLSSGFEIPSDLTSLVLHQKTELSKAAHQTGFTKNPNIGSEDGVVHQITRGRINRTQLVEQAVLMAFCKIEFDRNTYG